MAYMIIITVAALASAYFAYLGAPDAIQALLWPAAFTAKTKAKRYGATLVPLLLAIALSAESVSSIGTFIQDWRSGDTELTGVIDDAAAQAMADLLMDGLVSSSDDEADPLPPVDLTAEQIANFLDGFSFKFSNASLASLADERTKAIAKLGEDFSDAVNYPWMKLYERMDDITSGRLSGAELEAFYEEIRHDLYQEIISNPVMGYMILQVFSKIPAVTENNPWILDELAKFDQLLQTEKGISTLLEDVISDSGNKVRLVKDEYAELAAKICAGLDFFEFKGIATRKSVYNWHMPVILTDNQSHTEEADYQESRAALLLVYGNKDGGEGIALGINVFDKRFEIFGKNTPNTTPAPVVTTPEPATTTPAPTTPTTPSNPQPKPQPQPTRDPEPTYADVYIRYILKDTGEVFADHTIENVKEGAGWSRKSPTKTGYTCDTPTVTGKMSTPAAKQYKDVYYTPNAPVATNVTVTVHYWYDAIGGEPAADDAIRTVNKGGDVSIPSPKREGWTPDKDPVELKKVTSDSEVDVVYSRIDCKLIIRYHISDGKVQAPSTHTETIKWGKSFNVKSPPVTGYKPDIDIVTGTADKTLLEFDVTYYPIQTEVYIYYRYSYAPNTPAADTYHETLPYGTSRDVTSPDVPNHVPDRKTVHIDVKDQTITEYVYYDLIPGGGPGLPDGQGSKDKGEDPVNKDHTDIGGAPNPAGEDEKDKFQETDPDSNKDYPTEDENKNNGTNADKNNQNTSNVPITPNDPQESSGFTGGNDHPIQDAEGGYTEGGDVPVKNELPEGKDDVWVDTSGNQVNPWTDTNLGSNSDSSSSSDNGTTGTPGSSQSAPSYSDVNDDGGAFELD